MRKNLILATLGGLMVNSSVSRKKTIFVNMKFFCNMHH